MDADKLDIELLLKGMTQEQQATALDNIKESVIKAKAIQKQKIGENVQVVVQALKKLEKDFRVEYTEVADKLAERITSIKNGRDGTNGVNGKEGKDGRSGRDGAIGAKGANGFDGRNGVDGIDGVSVTNAYIDFDGSLIINLSSGQVLNVGEVVSQDLADKIQVISSMSTNGAIAISDEGTSISTGVKNFNFIGATVTATASGDDVTINVSAGTGSVTSVAATAGVGISVTGSPITTSGTLNIVNTAPDQIVALTGSGATTITGTYPNFTISSTGVGTVTSVAVSGGTTGLTTSGSPITTSGTITLAGTLAVANGGTGVTTSTGTGSTVLNTSPTLVTPALGTPSALVGTNITGTATAFTASNVTTNANLTGVVTSIGNATSLGSFTSAQLASALTDETGTGAAVFSTSPTLVTPALGTPSSGVVTNLTGTASININGTVGATTPTTGAFTDVNYTGTLTGGTGVVNLGSGQVYKDASGNVGIGTTTPTALGGASKTVVVLPADPSTADAEVQVKASGAWLRANSTNLGSGGFGGFQYYQNGVVRFGIVALGGGVDTMLFTTGSTSTERMRLDSSGRVQIGTTAAAYSASLTLRSASNSYILASSRVGGGTGNLGHVVFENDNGAVGTIFTSGSTTAYNTSSDYRLKDPIAPMTGALSQVAALKPCTYTWKVDGSAGQGFIAHELAAVVPGCVTGEKDAVDAEGKPIYQGIDTSFLVATLTAAIQELKAIVDTQAARITALEAK